MNLNKLFPRLSIRSKLIVAFALLALVPLVAAAVFAARTTEHYVRALAIETLEHDLELAQKQTERSLGEAERTVSYLAGDLLQPLFAGSSPANRAEIGAAVASLLSFTPALFQINVVDPFGDLLLRVRATGIQQRVEGEHDVGGLYYAMRAGRMGPDNRLMLPVELRGGTGSIDSVATVPVVAILVPVFGPGATFLGVVVGEAYAASLFAGLEESSPGLHGTTGLLNSDGLVLYHSARKPDWKSLLLPATEVDPRSDLTQAVLNAMLSGDAGTVESARGIVSYAPLRLSQSAMLTPTLYRVAPLETLAASIAEFRRRVALGGAIVLATVLGLAVLAARQFTKPILVLRRGARLLAQGKSDVQLQIETNDELEDLAGDFTAMSHQLTRHREHLEDLVDERSRALSEAHAKLTDILEHSADAIIGLDLQDCVRLWNRGAESLFGYGADEAIGQNIDALLLPQDPASHTEVSFLRRQLATRGAVINFQTKRAPKEGEPFPVSLTQSLISNPDGESMGYSLIVRDTREQARLEEQMRRSERISAVSVMAAGLAHELNNPIAILANRVECMESEVEKRCPECFLTDDLAVLHSHTDRLRDVTSDLLRFAQDDEDGVQPLALRDMSTLMLRLLQQTFQSRNIRLLSIMDDELPSPLGSQKAIETVCLNLLLNAADATPAGGTVTLTVRRSVTGDTVELEVTDTGPGIPVRLLHRIFEPFYTTKSAGRGTGLGLAICRSIVERHGGSIRVEAEEGCGSSFVVSLPLHDSEDLWIP